MSESHHINSGSLRHYQGFILTVLVTHATSESYYINSESHRHYQGFAATILVTHTTLTVSHTDTTKDLYWFILKVLMTHITNESHHINSESHRHYQGFSLTVF